MAAPNIVNVATITGKTAVSALTTTASTVLLANAADSGKVMKLNSLYVANADTASSVAITVSISAASITILANEVDVPGASTLVVIDKESQIYLEEDKGITVQAETASKLTATLPYEEIS